MSASQEGTSVPNVDWWDQELGISRESAAFSALKAFRGLQSSRIYSGLLYEATYEQRNMFGSDLGSGSLASGMGMSTWSTRGEINLLTYNAMQIGFDTLVSKLTQADAQVMYQTDGADWEVRQKASQLEKLTRGEFYRLKLYEVKEMIELDMLIHGRGYLKFYVDHDCKCPAVERVNPLDIFFDELEARDAPPQTMYQVRIVTKTSLKAQYPEYEAEINQAQLTGDSSVYSTRGINPTQMVEILEAWRLPSRDGAGDGRHALFIQTCTLAWGTWERMDFPFATMTWVNRRRGPYPISAAEQIIFLQRNLNRLIQRKHECIYTLSAPYILSSETQSLNMAQFMSDGVGVKIEYTADGSPPPMVVTNKVVPDDITMEIAQLKQDIMNILGVTGLESMGEKPQGLDSAPAQEAYTEQSSLRHVKTLKENERFVLRCAQQLLCALREIKDEYGDYAAFGQHGSKVEQVKFTDADLPPDAFQMQMAPANMLPLTPAGRLNKIVQLAGTGAFTPKQIIRAFQSPDIDSITNDVTSTEQDIEWTIYEMCKPGGRYLPPDEHQDLQTGIEKVNDAYLEHRRQNAPDAILERLDMWVSTALAMKQKMEAARAAQMMAQQQAMQAQQAPQGGGGQVPQGQAPGVPSAQPLGISKPNG